MDKIEEIVSVLTDKEQQLLKDTLNEGFWGDTDEEFLDENNEIENCSCYGYCTNDAKKAGNFKGREISSLFRSLYSKLCKGNMGRYISHCNDWWGDGSGDMLFIRIELCDRFEEWAKSKKK